MIGLVFVRAVGIGCGLYLSYKSGQAVAWTWASLWPLRQKQTRNTFADVYGILRKYRTPPVAAFYAFRDARYL